MKIKLPSRAAIAFFMEDGTIYRQRVYIILYVLLMSLLLLNAAVGRREEPSNISDTQLKSYQTVGDGSISLALVSKAYNPQKNILELEFKANGNNGLTTLTGNEIEFSGSVVRGKAMINIIPTINNHWTVLVTNLDPKFGALSIKVESNIPRKPTLNSSKFENVKPTFTVTQAHTNTNSNLEVQSIKSVALTAVDSETMKQKKLIKTLENQISDGQKLIAFDQNQIKKLQQNSNTLTSSEAQKATETITNLNQEIELTDETTASAKSKINSKNKIIDQLNDKKNAIKNGSFKFPAKQQTGQIQAIKPSKAR
jgi:hypothetical protein